MAKSETSEKIDTFDIMVNAEKKGVAYDQNPVQIETDDHCRAVLVQLMSKLPAGAYDQELLKSCLAVVTAKDGDEFTFGPAELVALGELASEFPAYAHEILACMDHITASLDFEGEVPNEVFKMAASAHALLGEATVAVAAANLAAIHVTPASTESSQVTPEVKSFANSVGTVFEMMKAQGYIPADMPFEAFLADMLDEDGDGSGLEDEDEETEGTEGTDGAHEAA